jgi:hypothetical protein
MLEKRLPRWEDGLYRCREGRGVKEELPYRFALKDRAPWLILHAPVFFACFFTHRRAVGVLECRPASLTFKLGLRRRVSRRLTRS